MAGWGRLALRLIVGAIFAFHGFAKLIPSETGGLKATAGLLAELGIPAPSPLAVLVGCLEAGAGLAVVLGYRTRLAVGILLVDLAVGLWRTELLVQMFASGALRPGLGELHLVLLASLICLALEGPGRWSVDERRARAEETTALGRARLRSGGV